MMSRLRLKLSCDDTGLLLSKKQHQQLSFKERISLRIHLIVCEVCKRYGIEIDIVHKELTQIHSCSLDGCTPYKLSKPQHEKILQAIEDQTVR